MPSRQSKAIWQWLSVICHGSWDLLESFHSAQYLSVNSLIWLVQLFSHDQILNKKSELQSTNIPPYHYPLHSDQNKNLLFLFSSSGQEMFEFIQLIFRLVCIQTLSQRMCTWLMQMPIKQSLLTIRWIRSWKGDKNFLNTWLWNWQMLTCLTHSKWTVKWIPWPNFPWPLPGNFCNIIQPCWSTSSHGMYLQGLPIPSLCCVYSFRKSQHLQKNSKHGHH